MFVALLIGWPLPLLPIQLLWINLVTDGLPAIGLATDMSEPGILNRPPRATQKSMMDMAFFKRVTFVGCLKALVILSVFAYEYLIDKDLIQAQDAAFSVLVTAELLWAFGARSDTKNIWQVGLFSNLRLFFIVSISFFPAGLDSSYPGIARIIWDTTGLIHPMPGLDSIGHGAFAHHRSSETTKEGTQ
ncbi:cation efflux transporter [Legionella pneumophila]|nr:cation efflux transporter [Legionella pneumophila]